uniref:GCK domain-containing protein n=1 Tax=Setaria digitata TaxID=48799 RepID=A0A915PSL0_9BILA
MRNEVPVGQDYWNNGDKERCQKTNGSCERGMTDRYMPSIFPECDKFKQVYDKCFTDFFEKFISTEKPAVSNPCSRLHETYRHCIEKNLEKNKIYDIDLNELRKDVLNTGDDLLKDSQTADK